PATRYSLPALRLPGPPLLVEIGNQASRSGALRRDTRAIQRIAIFIGISDLIWISIIYARFYLLTATGNSQESSIIGSRAALLTRRSTYLVGLRVRLTITHGISWSAAHSKFSTSLT